MNKSTKIIEFDDEAVGLEFKPVSTEYFSFKEAMSYMGFTTYDSLRNTIKLGLPVIHFGNSKRISKTAIDEFMKAHTVIYEEN